MMKILIVLSVLLAVANAQYGFPYRRYRAPVDEQYAASLGGAPVGLYGKTHSGGRGYGRPGYGTGSEVYGASLGGAKAGLYGKEHHQQGAIPYPVPVPGFPLLPFGKPYLPVFPRRPIPCRPGRPCIPIPPPEPYGN